MPRRSRTWLVVAVVAAISATAFSRSPPSPRKYKSAIVDLVEPDYARWQSIKLGMSEAEVRCRLGTPLEVDAFSEDYGKTPYDVKTIAYGRIQFGSPVVPGEFRFYIDFQMDKVTRKHDPFGGCLSRDGKPTTPLAICPVEGASFSHFPCFLDLRWHPSSGRYPIEYVIQIASGDFKLRDSAGRPIYYYFEPWEEFSDLPHCATQFNGRAPGRWRVKAKNELGESAWSEWRYFQFERRNGNGPNVNEGATHD